jgi:hypothetical protein
LARALAVEPDAVAVGKAALAWPAKLVVDDVATGDWMAGRVEVGADPFSIAGALLGGGLRAERVRVRDLMGELGAVGELEATVGKESIRVALRRVTVFGRCTAGEVGIEVDGGTLRRIAFFGASVAGIADLSGAATRAPDGAWVVRAARPGVTATAHVDRDGVAGQAQLEKLALGELVPRQGLAGSASGAVYFTVDGAGARVYAQLALDDLVLNQPRLTPAPITGLNATIAGELAVDGNTWVARGLRVAVGRTTLVVDGSLVPGGAYDLAITLPTTGCAELLASLPRALIPHLDGLLVDGSLAGRVHLAGFARSQGAERKRRADVDSRLAKGALRLAIDGTIGCRARADAALADVRALAHADVRALVRPRNPSWCALATLPTPVVRAFLVAEDGRFFVHHGFDVERIGRALATDLQARRFERGASTITQQVAKNLWLDGQRTVGRKLEEAVLAWRLEQVLDKRRILELYLNLVEMGPGVYGIDEASAKYFGKLPDQLTTSEAAQLAALLPAPRRGMDAAWERRYRALAARMPEEKIPMPMPNDAPTVQLTVR